MYRESFTENLDAWQAYYNDKTPQNAKLPAPWHEKLDDFARIIVLRCIRPDKVSIILLHSFCL